QRTAVGSSIEALRSVWAEPDDEFILNVLALIVIVVDKRSIEAITEEFDLGGFKCPFSSDISRESHAHPVLEGLFLTGGLDADGGVVFALNAQSGHTLEIMIVGAARLVFPGLQLDGDVGGR